MACRAIELLVILWLSCFVAGTGSAPTTAPDAPLLGGAIPPAVTRADLADSFVRLERVLHEFPPKSDDVARVSRAYDRAAFEFFTGKHSDAIRTMNELADSLLPDERKSETQRVIHSIKVRVAPIVALSGRPSVFHVMLSSLYPIELPQPLSLRLVVRSDDKIVLDEPIELQADAALPKLVIRQPAELVGTYRVQLVARNGQTFDMTRWYVTQTPLDVQRIVNERDLLRIDGKDPAMFQALVAARARNGLLTDKPAEQETSKWRMDQMALARDVRDEVIALAQGSDPYKLRAGDYWRAVPANQMQIPVRVYAPSETLAKGKPLPLVIALHGAGADENAFMDAYGDGEIKRLADKHDFLVASPSTYWCAPNPASFSGIVESLAHDYPIDRSRVYLIGHSLGAMCAANMAARNPDEVAAVVLLAGGDFAGARKLPPTKLVAAELDRVIPADQLGAVAQTAKASGLPVEFELMKEHGHVYMADVALPGAIEWLLSHEGSAATAPRK